MRFRDARPFTMAHYKVDVGLGEQVPCDKACSENRTSSADMCGRKHSKCDMSNTSCGTESSAD